MRIISIFILTFFIFTNVIAQSPDLRELKMLSWNIYMHPTFPMFTNQKKRTNGVINVLKKEKYDIICFQEAYHKGFHKIIFEELKEQYPYQIVTKNNNASFKASSGLWILSKQPIHKIKEIEFVTTSGLEVLVRKGAILFKMDGLNDFHFIVTHMQSADGVEETATRKNQSMQIYKELVEPYLQQNKTFLFAGDWNMESGSTFDNLSLRELFNINYPELLPIENTWPSPTFSKSQKSCLYDLIMLSDSNDKVSGFKTGIPNLQYQWKKGKNDLSDHLPIEATFLLKW